MLYAISAIIVLCSVAFGLYALFRMQELRVQVATLQQELEELEADSLREVETLKSELSKLEKIRHIPEIIERARKFEAEGRFKLEQARQEANTIIQWAKIEAGRLNDKAESEYRSAQQRANAILADAAYQASLEAKRLTAKAETTLANANDSLRLAKAQASAQLEDAQSKVKEILKQAKKEAKEKTQRAEAVLDRATVYANQIRLKAEADAEALAGKAYESRRLYDHYAAVAEAYKNAVEKYVGSYLVPSTHILDELAQQYGFHKAGEQLKTARERTRLMEKNRTAATCNYPDGWKRDYAINFILAAFNGKVDTILSRVKPAQQGKQIQEIKDAFAMVNQSGMVFRNARINPEYLDSRLEEYKWAVVVQKLKQNQREEQRAIREQMREEARSRKEYERALKQTQREEELLNKALEKARLEFAAASAQERAKLETRIAELSARLQEQESKKRALSQAQLTKTGYVYIISNVGSFGEDIYKIGLTRRLNPEERVRELGTASVPFPFDTHAMIKAENAPALEAALHKKFLSCNVNKINKKKEYFKTSILEIKKAVEELGLEAEWTITAEAQQYKETLALEKSMNDDPQLKLQWLKDQEAYENAAALKGDTEDNGEMVESMEENKTKTRKSNFKNIH